MTPQQLIKPALDPEQIRMVARRLIRDRYGSVPSAGQPIKEGETWVVPIHANYPRVLMDEAKLRKRKLRFMSFENLGQMKFSLEGEPIDQPRYFEIQGAIKARLQEVRDKVEQALVKVGANGFAKLAFPEHIFTPLQDILSWMLIEERADLNEFLSLVHGSDRVEKYEHHISLLETLGLLRREGSILNPGDLLIEIEMDRNLGNPEKLTAALALFYERGYHHLKTIRAVLGPHLTLSGFCYEKALEHGEPMPLTESEFARFLGQRDPSKIIKVPRYLIQLEGAQILSPSGPGSWSAQEELFNAVQAEEEILNPVTALFVG